MMNSRRSITPGKAPRQSIQETYGMSISTKLQMYNLKIKHISPMQPDDTDDSTPNNSFPLIQVPPHISPKALIKNEKNIVPKINSTSLISHSATISRIISKANLDCENIEDNDTEQTIPSIRQTGINDLLSFRNPLPDTTANYVPSLRCNSFKEVEIRAVTTLTVVSVHNLPKLSCNTRTMQSIGEKIRHIRAMKSLCWVAAENKTEKSGYLWKLSSKTPNKWKPKFCILHNNSFIWTKGRNSTKIQGCIQFEFFPGIAGIFPDFTNNSFVLYF